MKSLEVLFTPADFAALSRRNLDDTVCVVFDVFRATSSMITALANGATTIVPVAEIPEAVAYREKDPDVVLAGERDGLRIRAELTGGIDFDLGNSPREFSRGTVQGKTLVMSTTNGTRALRSCAHARRVLIAAFLNLRATADWIQRERPEHLLFICSGTFDQAAAEDILAAGALCDLCWSGKKGIDISDSALIARRLFQQAQPNLIEAASSSRNGQRLLSRPELSADVPFCLRVDAIPVVATLGEDGKVRVM